MPSYSHSSSFHGGPRETLRHGGQCGSAMDPKVWDHGPNVDSRVFADFASWLALLDLLIVCGTPMIRALLSANEVGRWLYSVVILVQFTASFLSYPQVPYWRRRHGQVWVSFVEPLILFEVWRLRDRCQKRSGRLLVFSPPPSPTPLLPSHPGVQIRVEYKVPSSLLRSLGRFGGWSGQVCALRPGEAHCSRLMDTSVVTNSLSGLWSVSYLAVLALSCHFWRTGEGRLLMWLMAC